MNKKQYTEDELQQVASQLRCPEGEGGLVMAKRMFNTNTNMLLQSLPYLNITNGNQVLELGHASCAHLECILNQASEVKYSGLEVSRLMNKEAKQINKEAIEQEKAAFFLYDGAVLPFAEKSFDRIITVNTIYFFENPQYIINQIAKLLKPNGIFALVFQAEEFIKTLPFTEYGFAIYNNKKVAEFLVNSGLKVESETIKTEHTVSKLGEKVERKYVIMKSVKSN